MHRCCLHPGCNPPVIRGAEGFVLGLDAVVAACRAGGMAHPVGAPVSKPRVEVWRLAGGLRRLPSLKWGGPRVGRRRSDDNPPLLTVEGSRSLRAASDHPHTAAAADPSAKTQSLFRFFFPLPGKYATLSHTHSCSHRKKALSLSLSTHPPPMVLLKRCLLQKGGKDFVLPTYYIHAGLRT